MDQRKIVFNSIRMRIIQFLIVNGESTTLQISKDLNEVPKTTLYRHMAVLEDAGIIFVVNERQIRGTIEKTYAINPEALAGEDEIETAKNNTFTYLMSVYGDFYKYFSNEDTEDYDGRLYIKSNNMYMNDEEFDDFTRELDELLEKYSGNDEIEGRLLRKISAISAPNA